MGLTTVAACGESRRGTIRREDGMKKATVQAYDPKALNLKRPSGRAKAVQCSLSHEVGWRLQQLASLLGVGPGMIVEALIGPTVMGVRLPYDSYGQLSIGNTSASASRVESGESEGDPTGETLPMGESVTSSEPKSQVASPGGGEGGKTPPAPAKTKLRRA
jgi:hypothetical protein